MYFGIPGPLQTSFEPPSSFFEGTCLLLAKMTPKHQTTFSKGFKILCFGIFISAFLPCHVQNGAPTGFPQCPRLLPDLLGERRLGKICLGKIGPTYDVEAKILLPTCILRNSPPCGPSHKIEAPYTAYRV